MTLHQKLWINWNIQTEIYRLKVHNATKSTSITLISFKKKKTFYFVCLLHICMEMHLFISQIDVSVNVQSSVFLKILLRYRKPLLLACLFSFSMKLKKKNSFIVAMIKYDDSKYYLIGKMMRILNEMKSLLLFFSRLRIILKIILRNVPKNCWYYKNNRLSILRIKHFNVLLILLTNAVLNFCLFGFYFSGDAVKLKHIFTHISRPKDLSTKLTESLYTHIKEEEAK